MHVGHLQGGELLQDRSWGESRCARVGQVLQRHVQAIGVTLEVILPICWSKNPQLRGSAMSLPSPLDALSMVAFTSEGGILIGNENPFAWTRRSFGRSARSPFPSTCGRR